MGNDGDRASFRLDRWMWPIFASLLFATAALTLTRVGNEDLWWYLASGDEILAQGAVPKSDPYLYTSAVRDTWVTTNRLQATWVNHSWLWTVVVALVDRALGTDGLALLQALAAATLASLLFTRARLDRFGLLSGVVTAAVLMTCLDRMALRAELAGWLLLAIYLVVFERGRVRGPTLVVLVAMQWLWSNFHGSYVLGLGLAGAYSLGRAASVPWWLLPLLVIASVATPRLGPERLFEAVALLEQLWLSTVDAGATPIAEWVGTYTTGFGPATWMHATVFVTGLVSFACARSPRSLPRMLVFLGLALLGASAIRFVGGFAIATGIVALYNFGEARENVRRAVRRAVPIGLQAGLAVALCAALLAFGAIRFASRSSLEVGQSRGSFAVLHPFFSAPGAADYLREHEPAGPVFNDIGLGGYLIRELYPTYQFFVDTRNLSAEVLEDYRQALMRPERWRELEHRYGFGVAVLGTAMHGNLPLRRVLASDPHWQLAFVDPQAAVFVRRPGQPGQSDTPRPDVPNASNSPNSTNRVPFLGNAWDGGQSRGLLRNYLNALIEMQHPGEAARLAGLAMEIQPEEPTWLRIRAFSRLQLGDARASAADYAQIVQSTPRNTTARFRYALALQRSGEPVESLKQLEILERLAPGHPGAENLRRQTKESAGR